MSEPIPTPVLTLAQLQGALALAGLRPDDHSPVSVLPDAEEAPLSEDDRKTLYEIGWLEDLSPPHLTPQAKDTLQALCHPRMTVSVLLGAGDSLYHMQFYSSSQSSDAHLISVIANLTKLEFTFMLDQNLSTVADMLMDQLLVGELEAAVEFQAQLSTDAFVALLAYVDWRLQSILTARLDRLSDADPAFRPADIWPVLVEGRTADDLNWLVTQFTYLIPSLNFGLDQTGLESAISDLQDQNLVLPNLDGRLVPADPLLELADALLPILSFAAVSVEIIDDDGQPSRTHLAYLRGRQATLMVQPAVGDDAEPVLYLDGLDGIELGELLFMMGLSDQQILGTSLPRPAQTAVAQTSSTNGAASQESGAGAAEEASTEIQMPQSLPERAPTNCFSCGAPLKPGRSYCTQCGIRIHGNGGDK